MKTIVFGFSKPKSWQPYAAAIMAYDKSNFDHGYIKFTSVNWGCDFIYQSSGFRTNFMGGDYFLSINEVMEEYALDVSDSAEGETGALCVKREGLRYPVKMIFGLGLVKFIGILSFGKLKLKNPFPTKLTDCIAEQAFILAREFKIDCPLNFNEATPLEFRDWLRTITSLKRIK